VQSIVFEEYLRLIIFIKRGTTMSKRIFFAFVICFAFLLVVSYANASVEGTWTVDGTVRLKMTIRGHSKAVSANATEEFTFDSNGDFAMTDMTGTWKEKNKQFTVRLDRAEAQTYLESALADDGLNASITITQCTLTGTEGKSTIRGKMTLNARFFLPDYGLHGTMTATVNFAGAKTTVAGAASAGPEVSESLKAAIREQVSKSLSTLEEWEDRMR
jgi:hypothetical protein